MDLATLRAATEAQRRLEKAERDFDIMVAMEIIGIQVASMNSPCNPITLARGSGGTGTVTSIGFPDGLKDTLCNAMRDYFNQQIKDAQRDLEALGIEVAA